MNEQGLIYYYHLYKLFIMAFLRSIIIFDIFILIKKLVF